MTRAKIFHSSLERRSLNYISEREKNGNPIFRLQRILETIWIRIRIDVQKCHANSDVIFKPIAKAGLARVKEQGLGAIRDIASGQNVKQVLKRRGKTAAKSTLNRLVGNKRSIKKPTRKNALISRLSPNFIADTMNWFLNSMLD